MRVFVQILLLCYNSERMMFKYGNQDSISLSHHLQVESRTEFMRHLVSDIRQLKEKSEILPLTERKHRG